MYLSLNWLNEFIPTDCSNSELDNKLTMLGIEVESIQDYRNKYRKFVVAEVLEKEKHPDADKLSICRVNDGTGTITVVCGAPNVAAGQKVVFAQEGAIVPNGGWKIEKRKVRKVESCGMICSKAELELEGDHSGIWELPTETPVGTPLADFLGLNDTVFEISMTPNRPDCLNHVGIARELSAESGQEIKMPTFKLNETGAPIADQTSVEVLDSEKCPRYMARLIRGAKITESPEWLRNRLIACGTRPINAAVDVTNLVLLECGQPLHAFDFAKLKGGRIVVRTVADGEKFTTLDSKERTLDSSMLMICDASSPVAVGGVMGGENSEITDSTTDILIESAFFAPSSVRRTAKKLGIQSESSYRFERGVDIDNLQYALDRAAALITELCGGQLAKGLIDVYPNPVEKQKIELNYARARRIIGIDIPSSQIDEMMSRLLFRTVAKSDESITVEVPSHRVDVFGEIDLVEEVARLYNYDNIHPVYETTVSIEGAPIAKELSVAPERRRLRDHFVHRGFHEILTQNMLDPVSSALFTENPVRIANPLGEELSTMRPSAVPAMLRTVERNRRNGTNDLRMFEIGKVFANVPESEKTFIPGIKESEHLTVAIAGKACPQQWAQADRNVDFYDIKGIAEELIAAFGYEKVDFRENKDKTIFSKNSLSIVNRGAEIGAFGEVSKKLLKTFDVDTDVFLLTIDLEKLFVAKAKAATYSKVSPYPTMARDLAFITPKSAAARDMLDTIRKSAGQLLKSVNIFDVYEGKSIPEGKRSVAFSLVFSSPERTLTEQEVETATAAAVQEIEKKFSAELRKM